MKSKKYDAKEAEPRIQKKWIESGFFKFDKKSKKQVYAIDTPPPTVSGKMHIGHAFQYSQMDFIARYKRMKGFNVFYPFGTDDNGLPTKLLIEKEKKVKASEMSRKEFTKFCLKILKNELRPKYMKDFKAIGLSCDWDLFYTTINEHCQKISQKSFIDLYNQGREYRTEAAAMYCPRCQTAISQVELEDKKTSSFFNDIVFKINDEKEKEQDLIIATTRPELLPAIVAVFYHPDDKRYKKLKGKNAKVPLFDIEVPILEDKNADPEKGTGIVMCCTFGDMADVEWQKAHNLPIKEAINKQGKMTGLAGKYRGMEIKQARKQIIEDLKQAGLLIKQEPIQHEVNVHERCGTPVEFVHSKQWFIKYLDLKKDMMRWGKQLNWFPQHMKNRYDNWVKGLGWDWCISRQLPFGVPFPVWYCEKCDRVILADEKDLPVDPAVDKPPVNQCPECKSTKIVPEKDIINTWATSSLTPQIAASLVPERFDDIYPMSLRPQAHDIISFWLFNTVVKSQLHYKKNPWKDVMISGWALDPKGKKMSKSKGNVVEPQEMIEKYSADALRFWAASTKLGEDNPFQEKELVTGEKFITKLWNASKFAFMHLEDYNLETEKKPKKMEAIDKWIIGKLNQIIIDSTKNFDNYEYSKTKAEVENFFWNVFCDNYLEIVKDRLYNPEQRGERERQSAQFALHHTVLNVLKLMAPIMPHITDEIYSLFYKQKQTIHIAEWPSPVKIIFDEKAGDTVIEAISEIRKYKAKKQMSLKKELNKIIIHTHENLEPFLEDLKSTTHAKDISVKKSKQFKIEIKE